jgi:hypothetical protein
MWQEANSWRDPNQDTATPTVFDHAAHRIGQEVHDRSGLDSTQIIALAAVQELEREHEPTVAEAVDQPAGLATAGQHAGASRGFDDPQRREQLRQRLAAARVPEPATEARTLADLAQSSEAAEATRTPVAASAEPQRAGRARSVRELTRRR